MVDSVLVLVTECGVHVHVSGGILAIESDRIISFMVSFLTNEKE